MRPLSKVTGTRQNGAFASASHVAIILDDFGFSIYWAGLNFT
jgi:hypothetical protein